MLKLTVGEIAKQTGLSKKIVLKHLHARTLPYSRYSNSHYYIDEIEYDTWLNDIPDLDVFNLNSQFCSVTNVKNHLELYREYFIKSYDYLSEYKRIVPNSKYTFADMFCGCGGLSLGFVHAGFRPIEYIDIFEDALRTYYKNIIEANGFNTARKGATADITNEKVKEEVISILKKNKVKVICGGFPCQGFSNSGTCVASDPRNVLYKDMLEIVAKVKPDYIVMENVLGILSMLDGKVVDTILSDYESIGYKITYKIMNSVNYGVPQNRERVIFIGNRAGKNNYFPNKVLSRKFKTVQETIEKYGNIENPNINHIFSKHSVAMQNRLANVPLGGHLYSNYSDSWRKTYPGKPSCTIKENHGATNIHYMYPRTMSPREIAALQSFPDDFIFIGTKATILKQIGNAVPPLMAKAIALAIKKALKE